MSDLTRIIVTGKISPKLRKIYGVVLKAQLAAIDAIRPGRTCEEVDRVARQIITRAGFGKAFGHGLGHGTGLEIHEGPGWPSGKKPSCEPGMIVTVEPGIYVPGWGGVRIEDDVLVTRTGHEVLYRRAEATRRLRVGIVTLGVCRRHRTVRGIEYWARSATILNCPQGDLHEFESGTHSWRRF